MSKPILSLSKPKPLPSPLLALLGQRIVIQQPGVRYEGVLRQIDPQFIVIDDVLLNGTKVKSQIKRVLLKNARHLHAVDAVVSLEAQP